MNDALQNIAEALGLNPSLLPSTARRLYHLEGLDGDEAPGQLLVQAWTMREALNEHYELRILCLSAHEVDLEALLGRFVRLRTTLADGGACHRSGVVCQARRVHADGALHRVLLTVVPYGWLMTGRTASAIWQQRTLPEIIDDLLEPARGAGHWRFSPEVTDFLSRGNHSGRYTLRVQYRESEHTFFTRETAREGLVWRWAEDDQAPGRHTLHLLADTTDPQACPEDPSSAQAPIRFHRASSQEDSDSIQALGRRHSVQPGTTTLLAWDPATRRSVTASVPGLDPALTLEDYDHPHTFSSPQAAGHYALIRRQAAESRAQHLIGRGTVRTWRAGTRARVTGSPLGELELLLTRVEHLGINNLPQELTRQADKRLGTALDELTPDPQLLAQAQQGGYANRFNAVPANVPWRDQQHPRAAQPGTQSATVVDEAGQTGGEIHRDARGRVRVRFHWQQGQRPDDRHTCWVQVMQPYAGAAMGSSFIPRLGQEVLISFSDGDPERPLVRAAVYNGRGEGGIPATPGGNSAEADRSVFSQAHDHRPSGQGNLTAGHSPAWHGGATAEHHNVAALSGIKTKEFAGEGFNQLVLDDSNAQLRVQWGSTQHATWLSLGHLIHQADNHRGSFRGLGWELRTDAWGAVRAAQGILISSYGTQAQDPAGDNAPGQALMRQTTQLAQTFSDAAGTHQTVKLAGHIGSSAANQSHLSQSLAPLKAMQQVLDGMVAPNSLDSAKADAQAKSTSGQDKLPHTTDPVIGIAAKGGLAMVAGQDIVLGAAEGIHIAAGQDSTRAVGGSARLHTGQAIGVLAGAIQPGGEAAGTGVTMIAGKGDITVQAQADAMQVAAQGLINVQSVAGPIDWAAASKITLRTGAGASITIEGGGITVQCPGKITVRAATKSMVGAGQVHAEMARMSPASGPFDEVFSFKDELGSAAASVPLAIDKDGALRGRAESRPDGSVARTYAHGVQPLKAVLRLPRLETGNDEF